MDRTGSTASSAEEVKQQAPPARTAYVYVEKHGTPNLDAKPKEKSRLGKFLSKFQSPAVKGTTAARDRVKLEEERTGVKKVQVTDVDKSSNAWAAEHVA